MASIGPVTLTITDINNPPNHVIVEVSYRISASHHDLGHEQAYREVVELIGVDTLAGEDQVDDIIHLDEAFWDGNIGFTPTGPAHFDQGHTQTLPAQAVDEDPHPFLVRADEIRARVTLTPIPPGAPFRDSNLVVRGGGVIGPTT
jgi:hypothetical protein